MLKANIRVETESSSCSSRVVVEWQSYYRTSVKRCISETYLLLSSVMVTIPFQTRSLWKQLSQGKCTSTHNTYTAVFATFAFPSLHKLNLVKCQSPGLNQKLIFKLRFPGRNISAMMLTFQTFKSMYLLANTCKCDFFSSCHLIEMLNFLTYGDANGLSIKDSVTCVKRGLG